jgi:N-acetylglutamate synthase-like GNAT family acetyltransferase
MEKNEDTEKIDRCEQKDFHTIYEIINDAATAYHGIIPDDMWHTPYMTKDNLKKQIAQGVQFWGFIEQKEIVGVMGIQFKGDVTLIRHAYVRTEHRNKGIGSQLLQSLCEKSATPILIGTWAAATWAVKFYQNHGFRLMSTDEKDKVLRKYWTISVRQIDTSVVLASSDWFPAPNSSFSSH